MFIDQAIFFIFFFLHLSIYLNQLGFRAHLSLLNFFNCLRVGDVAYLTVSASFFSMLFFSFALLEK
jgi:hypothetical protein